MNNYTKNITKKQFINFLDSKNSNNNIYKNINNDNDDEKKVIDNLIISYNIDFQNKVSNIPFFSGINHADSILFNANNPNNYIDPVILKCVSIHLNTKYKPKPKPKLKINTSLEVIKNKVVIDVEINTLKDLLDLIEKYKIDPGVEYNINIETLHKIKQPIIDLDNMIGMKNLKTNVVDQILYFMQGLHITDDKSGDFLHTVIYGPPGTGKTEVAKILGKIFGKLGILSKGTFKKVTRSDLIAGYLGQTAIKTSDVIKECLGGVLFIDEAYSLGNTEKGDSFSKECIDTLCEALSDKKSELMVIIAGYETELNECFFSYNKGLDSRFTWRFKTDEYTPNELYQIFLKKVKEIGWEIAENSNINDEWFKKNKDYFKFYGRDMETLLAKTKLAHSKRVFCKPENEKRKITLKDLDVGMQMYLNNDEVKKRKDKYELNRVMSSMYI
jgi:SpoVK/Ycf46/Vps4 family AAA+-type ATPase